MEYIGEWMLHDMAEVGSTNDEVKKLSENIIGEKVIISAQRQISGRGRRGHSWIGLDGNLFFSQGLECDLSAIGAMVFISTLSLWRTIQNLNSMLDVKLKWPNDILVNDKKVSGMLLEKRRGRLFDNWDRSEFKNSAETGKYALSLYEPCRRRNRS